MRVAALILGILGGLLAGFLGLKWMGDMSKVSEMDRMLAQAMGRGEELKSLGTAASLLVVGCFAGVAGGILAFKDKLALGGGLMLAAGVVPLFYASQAVVFTALLIIGGLVALAGLRKGGSAAPVS
jgi:hypothetical protein